MKDLTKGLENKYSAADDEQLLRIIHSNDYTESAKSIALRLLQTRGISESTLANWRDPAAREHTRFWANQSTPHKVQVAFARRRTLYIFIFYCFVSNLGLGLWSSPVPVVEAIRAVLAISLVVAIFLNIFTWRAPALILVLRPYNDSHSSRSLRKFIKKVSALSWTCLYTGR